MFDTLSKLIDTVLDEEKLSEDVEKAINSAIEESDYMKEYKEIEEELLNEKLKFIEKLTLTSGEKKIIQKLMKYIYKKNLETTGLYHFVNTFLKNLKDITDCVI